MSTWDSVPTSSTAFNTGAEVRTTRLYSGDSDFSSSTPPTSSRLYGGRDSLDYYPPDAVLNVNTSSPNGGGGGITNRRFSQARKQSTQRLYEQLVSTDGTSNRPKKNSFISTRNNSFAIDIDPTDFSSSLGETSIRLRNAVVSRRQREEQKIEAASCIVKDCIAGRDPDVEKSRSTSRKYYDIYYHPATRWFVFAVVALHMILALFEIRSVSWRNEPDNNCLFNEAMQKAANVTRKIEIVFLIVYWGDLFLKAKAKRALFLKGNWNKLTVGIIFLMTLDIILANANAFKHVARSVDGVRFSRPLRPALLVALSPSLRRHARSTFRTFFGTRYLLSLTALTLTVFALAGVIAVRSLCPGCDGVVSGDARWHTCTPTQCDEKGNCASARTMCYQMQQYFDDSLIGVLSLFVLTTTENFPDIWYPFLNYSALSTIVFFAFIVISVFMFNPVLFAVVFDEYKKHQTREILKRMDKTDEALLAAFKLLRNSKDVISYDIYVRLMDYVLPNTKPEYVKVYFAYLDEDGSGSIDALEFIELTEILSLRLIEQKSAKFIEFLKRFRYVGTGWPPMQSVVNNRWFSRVAEAVIVLNLLVLILITYFPPGSSLQRPLSTVETILFGLFGVELLCRLVASGLSFVSYYWLVFDFVVFMFGMLFTALNTGLPTFSTVGRVIRVIRIFLVAPEYAALMRTFSQIIPSLMSFVGYELCIVYFFAVLGIMMFECSLQSDPQTDGAGVMNFDTISGSMMMLFQLIIVNNWNSSLSRLMNSTNYYAALYFVSFFIIVSMLVTNLLVSLIIESYLMNYEENTRLAESEKERQQMKTSDNAHDNNSQVDDELKPLKVKIELHQTNEQKLAMHLSKLDPTALRSREDRIEALALRSQVNLVELKKEKERKKEEALRSGQQVPSDGNIRDHREHVIQKGGHTVISVNDIKHLHVDSLQNQNIHSTEIECIGEELSTLLYLLSDDCEDDEDDHIDCSTVLDKIQDLVCLAEDMGADMSSPPFNVACNYLMEEGGYSECDECVSHGDDNDNNDDNDNENIYGINNNNGGGVFALGIDRPVIEGEEEENDENDNIIEHGVC